MNFLIVFIIFLLFLLVVSYYLDLQNYSTNLCIKIKKTITQVINYDYFLYFKFKQLFQRMNNEKKRITTNKESLLSDLAQAPGAGKAGRKREILDIL